MSILVVIQARTNSKRIPGKIFKKIGNTVVYKEVLRRAELVENIDKVCFAISDNQTDDFFAKELGRNGIDFIRGDEENVLNRFIKVSKKFLFDHIIRIPCDKPLIDPDIISFLTKIFWKMLIMPNINITPSWPHGLDIEIFKTKLLSLSYESSRDPKNLEHVTPWMRENKNLKIINLKSKTDLSFHRWTIDYEEDLQLVRQIFSKLNYYNNSYPTSYKDVLNILDENPYISNINKDYHEEESRSVSKDRTSLDIYYE